MGILRELVEMHRTFRGARAKKPAKPSPNLYMRPYIRPPIKRKYLLWSKCDKCGKLLRNTNLIHHQDIDEYLCNDCTNLLKIYRGED